MRLSFPMRVSLAKTVAFAGVLACVQLLEHTSVYFSLLCFSFIVLSAIAFNAAGGFSRPSGAYVFFFSVLTVTFGVVMKAALGEAADSNLETPIITMTALAGGMAMMLIAVLIARRVTARAPGVAAYFSSDRMDLSYSAIGCFLIGMTLLIMRHFYEVTPGSFLAAITQIDFFLPLGIILSTIDVVTKSDGRKSLNAINGFALLFAFFFGMLSFSKQGMFTPFVAWALGVVYGRLRIRPIHVIVCAGFAVLAFTVLTPISEVGRNLPRTTFAEEFAGNVYLIENLAETRALMLETEKLDVAPESHYSYFNVPVSLVERFTMIKVDDTLIAFTTRNKPIGYGPVRQYFENWIPHILAPKKSIIGTQYSGNYYAHEIGDLLATDDTTTGISFSPVSEVFHIAGWVGVFLLAPALWIMLFVVADLVCGDLRRSPWGLLAILIFAHIAPEGGIGAIIAYTWNMNIGIIFAMFLCVYITPVLGSLLGTSFTKSQARGQLLGPVPTAEAAHPS